MSDSDNSSQNSETDYHTKVVEWEKREFDVRAAVVGSAVPGHHLSSLLRPRFRQLKANERPHVKLVTVGMVPPSSESAVFSLSFFE